jgi:anti-sigma factor RsiW
MNLQKDTAQLHAFVDGELDLAAQLAMEDRVRADAALRRQVDEMRQLRASVREHGTYHAAPAGLHQRIAALHAAQQGAASSLPTTSAKPATPGSARGVLAGLAETSGGLTRRWFAWRPTAAAMGMAAVLAVAVNVAWLQISRDDQLADDVIASHVRSTLGEHLVDVATSDHHTVKPFLSARLGFSPPVAPLELAGSVFVGGRVDYLDGRPVAALVYRQGQHIVNSFVWPAKAGDSQPRLGSERGYLTARWSANGMQHWVVSDVNAEEFKLLVKAVQATDQLR